MFACGSPEKKVEAEEKVTPEDTTAGMVDTSVAVEAGDTIDVDSTVIEEEEVKKEEYTPADVKEIPKHGSPDEEEIRKMKEEKNKKK
jgi:hypothetical protein